MPASPRDYVPKRVKRLLRSSIPAARYALARACGQNPLLPPPWLHSVGEGDFEFIGGHLFECVRALGDLTPSERVLDIGSGTGRLAKALTAYLTTGTYDGVDVVLPSIMWCRRAYAAYPNFRFHHADLHNPEYHQGTLRASEYRFPFDDSSFDLIVLASVFTHMLPEDVRHYLREIARLLAPTGRAVVSAFLLNPETDRDIAAGRARFSFQYRLQDGFAEWSELPERAIAFDEIIFRGWIEASGLALRETELGAWRGGSGLSFQDFLVLAPRS